MRRKLSLFVALVGALIIAAPVGAITNGAADAGEHPYVGELLFYVPDAKDSRFDDPGGWFTCSGTLLNSKIVVTAGHCTFGVGENGVSTTDLGVDTTAAEGGSGGNDVWVNFGEAPDFSILPPSSGFGRSQNPSGTPPGPRHSTRAAPGTAARPIRTPCTTTTRSSSTTPASWKSARESRC